MELALVLRVMGRDRAQTGTGPGSGREGEGTGGGGEGEGGVTEISTFKASNYI
jgi:hypothetical protein